MTEQQAKGLAAALGGDVVRTMPQSRSWGVALTRADGRYVLIELDAGAVYFDEHACWEGYHVCGSDPRGDIHAEEWIEWATNERWARSLATLIGGEPWRSGGNIWLVLYQRPDGRLALIADTGAEVYESREQFEADQSEPERFQWD